MSQAPAVQRLVEDHFERRAARGDGDGAAFEVGVVADGAAGGNRVPLPSDPLFALHDSRDRQPGLPALQRGLQVALLAADESLRREVGAAVAGRELRHDRRTWVHTVREEFATYYPLADLLRWLGDHPFIPIGRHAVVNLHAIERVTHYGDRLYRVRLRDRLGTEITASRSGAVRLAAVLKTKR